MVKFLGIDFGWVSGPSGLCCLEWRDHALHLIDLTRAETPSDLLAWCDRQLAPSESAGIAVDAPTLIPNLTGMRLPDKLTHKYFGRYHAGCYPANRSRPFAQRTLQLGLDLEARGFHHAPTITAQQSGRFQIEVFPHPACIHLFQLPQILKYKKGKLPDRRSELAKLHHYIITVLPTLEPPLNPPQLAIAPLQNGTGRDLKALEDKLDSLICAYVAAHWWYWGQERNWVLGNGEAGYIVVPAPRNNPQPPMAQ